jgi:hypothetical protein
MPLYDVRTQRFGVVRVERDSLQEARRWAREALGILEHGAVTAHRTYLRCNRCDCAPCVCMKEGRS